MRLPPLVGAGGTLLSERPKLKLAADKGEPNTMDTQTDCLLIGTAVADVLIRPVPLTQPVGGGRLLHAEPLAVTTGGLVCNTGVAMRRLGMRVAAASLVGEDLWAATIRDSLSREGIDTAGLETRQSIATSSTAVLIDPSGERSFVHHVGGCAAIDLGFIRDRLDLFAASRWVLIGYIGLLPGLEADLAEAVRLIAATGCKVAIETAGDGGRLEQVAPALPHVDLYVPSLDEARAQTGRDDPRAIIEHYRSLGARGLIGVKLGTAGTLLSPAVDEWLEVPCLAAPGPVVDTTGAGDSLLAGLLTGLLRGLPVAEAGLLGAATAACCVTGVGATDGLRDYAATCQVMEQAAG